MEDSFQDLPGGKITHLSGELDGAFVRLGSPHLERVVAGQLPWYVFADHHLPKLVDRRCPFEEQNPDDKHLGVLHLFDGLFPEMLVKLLVPPLAHISECTMYWLMALNSSVSKESSVPMSFLLPFVIASFGYA